MIQLAPLDRRNLTEEIVGRLVDFIVERRLVPGNRLPSERELMRSLGVGRSSLREAMKMLRSIGVIEVTVGDGTFVGRGDTSMLSRPLAWGLLMRRDSVLEVIEARRCVEIEIAGFAAERAGDGDVAALRACVDEMRAALGDPDRYTLADVAFHLELGRVAGNHILLHVLQTLQHIIRGWIAQSVTLAENGHPTSLDEHVAIYDAIAAHDSPAARRAMERHQRDAAQRLISTLPAFDDGAAAS